MNLQLLLFKRLSVAIVVVLMSGIGGCVYYPYHEGYVGYYGGYGRSSLGLEYAYPYSRFRYGYHFNHYPRYFHRYHGGSRYGIHLGYGRRFHGYHGRHHFRGRYGHTKSR